MSKEEFLKIQTCVLKVNIHCDGCKRKVKKILQKIDGVYTVNIDSDLGKVTVSGNVDPPTLIKKLGKNGKHAELWNAPKPNQNPQNQFKNMQIDNGKGGNGNNPPKGGQNGQKGMGVNNPPKQGQNGQIPNQQQMMMMKALQDMKLAQLNDMKMPMGPPIKDQNQKNVKFNLPEEDDLSEGEFDDDYDEDDYDDDELDDDYDDVLPPNHPLNKMKPVIGANGQIPNMMMTPEMMAKIGNLGGGGGGGGGQNGKKGVPGGGSIQVPIADGKNGKKGGGGGGNGNIGQIQGGGKNGKGGGGEGKMGNNGGGAQNKGNGGGGQNGNLAMNGGKKGGMSDGVQGLPNMGNGLIGMGRGAVGQLGNMPMGSIGQMGPMAQMGNHMQMGQMGQVPAVQGLPASAMGSGGGGYFPGAGPEAAAGNLLPQQQMAAMMMNQQRANGNERFQPMMYARPPPAVNFMPPYPYPPYPYPYQYPPPGEPYAHAFSDENTSSCNVM